MAKYHGTSPNEIISINLNERQTTDLEAYESVACYNF